MIDGSDFLTVIIVVIFILCVSYGFIYIFIYISLRHVYAGTSATQAQMAHRAQHPVVNTVSVTVLLCNLVLVLLNLL